MYATLFFFTPSLIRSRVIAVALTSTTSRKLTSRARESATVHAHQATAAAAAAEATVAHRQPTSTTTTVAARLVATARRVVVTTTVAARLLRVVITTIRVTSATLHLVVARLRKSTHRHLAAATRPRIATVLHLHRVAMSSRIPMRRTGIRGSLTDVLRALGGRAGDTIAATVALLTGD